MEDETLTLQAEKHKNKGNDEFKLGNVQQAIDCYTKAIDLCPTEKTYYTNRAMAYLKLEEPNLAMQDCQRAIQQDEKFAKAYNRMSKCYVAMGDLQSASMSLAKSLELSPKDAVNKKDQRALNDIKITDKLVHKAIAEEHFDRAVAQLTNLLEHTFASLNHICLKIECMLKAFKFEDAAKYSATLMKSDKFANNPRILCWRGKVLIYTGADVLGKKHLQQAMNFDPDLKECLMVIKMVKKSQSIKEEAAELFKAQKYSEAIEKFQECLDQDQFNAAFNSTILLNMGICHHKLGDKPTAMDKLNLAIKYNPRYAKAYVKKGELLVEMEEYDEAVRQFSEASEYDQTGFGVQQKLKDAQERAKKAKRKDYYKILGIDKGAGDSQIKKAYKKMALKYHPDKNSGSEEERVKAEKMFKDVNEANTVLLDAKKRQLYDEGHDIDDINSGKAGGMGGMGGMDPNDLFAMFMGGGGGMGGMGGRGRGRGRGGGMPPGFGGFDMGGSSGGQSGFTFRFG